MTRRGTYAYVAAYAAAIAGAWWALSGDVGVSVFAGVFIGANAVVWIWIIRRFPPKLWGDDEQ